MVRERLETPGL